MSPILSGWKRSPNGIFVDRCLPERFAEALGKFQVQAVHMNAIYPGRAEHVADEEWIADSAENGFMAVTVNPRMVTVPHQMALIMSTGAHVFSLANPNLRMEAKAMIVGRWLPTLLNRASKPGGCFWRLDPQTNRRDVP